MVINRCSTTLRYHSSCGFPLARNLHIGLLYIRTFIHNFLFKLFALGQYIETFFEDSRGDVECQQLSLVFCPS